MSAGRPTGGRARGPATATADRPGSRGRPSPAGSTRVVKRIAEWLLCETGIASVVRVVRRTNAVILAYHNIVPRGAPRAGELSLHLPQAMFARQLECLRRTHRIGPLDALLSPDGDDRRPRAAITFDDAYRGAVTVGVEELVRRGLPATIFVAPAFVGGRSFWWDVLARARGGEIPPRMRRHALDSLRGDDREIRAWMRARGLGESDLPTHQTAASEEELAAAASHPGITLGSHSWSHRNLTRLAPGELTGELHRPLRWLRERYDAVSPWLSYPYGAASDRVQAAAERAGYRAALMIDGGLLSTLSRSRRRFAAPRVNVPAGVSVRGFELRTSGLLHG